MKTLYLHIGTPKTGTSAIQYFCVKNREVLEEKGLYYPDFGYQFKNINSNRNGAFYVANIFDAQNKQNKEEEARVRAEALETLKKHFETHDTILLSDEGFWNHPKMMNTKDWAELLEFSNKIGAKLKIIVYLRRQDEVIESYWAQKIKESNMQMNLSKYISSGKYTKFQLDYYEHLQKIADAIGKENIIVRVYEKEQYQGKGGTLLSDFFSIFGLDISQGFTEPDVQKNPSLHGVYLETKRLLNSNHDMGKWGSFIISRLKDVQAMDEENAKASKRMQFPYEDAVAFLKNYEEANQKIAKEYLDRDNGVLFYKELDPANYKEAESKYEEIKKALEICARIMVIQEAELEQNKTKIKGLKQKLKKLKSLEGWRKYFRKLKIKK